MIELTGHSGLVVALAYSPDGRTLASASADGTARLWDLATGRLTATLQSPAARAHCVAFSPDGESLAVGYGEPSGVVQIWDVDPSKRRESWLAHPRVTRGVAYSPDGEMLATAGDEREIRLWRPTGDVHHPISASMSVGRAVAFSADGKFFAVVSGQRGVGVSVWRATGTQPYRRLHGLSEWGYAITFHPENGRIAAGLEGTVALWDPADYRRSLVWPAHAGAVLGVAFTPDGQTLLTGGADGLGKLWDPAGRLRHTFDWKVGDVGAVAFAPDGLTAAAGGDGTILVWDVAG